MSDTNIYDLLGNVFGTTTKVAAASPTAEDMAKQANLEFFNHLVTSKGIDLDRLSEGEVGDLYKAAMDFKAKEEGKGKKDEKAEKEEEEKKEAAARVAAAANEEVTEKRAAASKIAEAEFLGRVMAHSFADESKKIAAAHSDKVAGEMPPQFAKKDGKEKDEKDEKSEDDKKKEASARAAALVTELSKAASTGGTPNLDKLAAEHALELLKEAGVNDELAFALINAEYIRGLPESTKIASTQSNAEALHVRALEYCERAGFPVDWPQ